MKKIAIGIGFLMLISACSKTDDITNTLQDAISPSSAPSTDITVFHNGIILTVDNTFSQVEAMAIRNNKIIAVGSENDVIAKTGTTANKIDLQGKVVMPGFIDPHLHTIAAAQLVGLLEDVGLTRFRSIEAALEHMISVGKKSHPGDWLMFNNIDFGTQHSDSDKLTAVMLDKVSTDNPVFVLHAGGHVSSVNSKMLQLMGVTKDTPNPEAGGVIGKTDKGEPDGVFYGFASLIPLAKLEPFNSFDREKGVNDISSTWTAAGLTTLGDAGVGAINKDELALLEKLSANGKLQQRLRGYLSVGQDKFWQTQGIKAGYGNDKFRIVGFKVSADGSNQARTGLQREHYLGTDSKGLPYMEEQTIHEYVVNKSKAGFQIAMHGNGDGAIDNIISAVSRAKQKGVKVIRPRIEHCSIVQDDQLKKLKELDINCSFLIGHVRLWGSAFRKTVFGQEKAEKLDRTGSFERAGVPYTLHSDAAVTNFTPLEMIEIAVTRELFSEPGYILAPDERASRKMAIRAVTSTASWQLMSENQIGSLEVGKFADFVVLTENPLTVKADVIGEIPVLQTWIDGKRVH